MQQIGEGHQPERILVLCYTEYGNGIDFLSFARFFCCKAQVCQHSYAALNACATGGFRLCRVSLRSQCIGKSDFKKIEDTVNKPLYDRMHIKLQTQKAKRMKKLRSSTVEPVLGSLVNFLGMRRVNTRGLEQANKCMLMAAIACNLKKLLKFTERKTQINVQAMQANLQALFFIKTSLTKQPYLLTALLYVKQNCCCN